MISLITYRKWKRADVALQLSVLFIPFLPFPAVTFWTGKSFWSACILIGCVQLLSGLFWIPGSRGYEKSMGRIIYYFTLLAAVLLALVIGWSGHDAVPAVIALLLLLPVLGIWYFVLTVQEWMAGAKPAVSLVKHPKQD